jgi:hypothetical protein
MQRRNPLNAARADIRGFDVCLQLAAIRRMRGFLEQRKKAAE